MLEASCNNIACKMYNVAYQMVIEETISSRTLDNGSRVHRALFGITRNCMATTIARKFTCKAGRTDDGVRGQSRNDFLIEEPQGSLSYETYRYKVPLRQAVQKGEIDVRYCETKRMIADTLTKGLPKPAFEKHRGSMNIKTC